jgi:hypothetical protein
MNAQDIAKGTKDYLNKIGRIVAIEATLECARVDIMSLKPNSFYDNGDLTIYEIKVNRSDFLNELKQKKYLRAMQSCNRFYYLCPPYLITPKELPVNAGLCFYNGGNIEIIKYAKRQKLALTYYTLIRFINKLSEELKGGVKND